MNNKTNRKVMGRKDHITTNEHNLHRDKYCGKIKKETTYTRKLFIFIDYKDTERKVFYN